MSDASEAPTDDGAQLARVSRQLEEALPETKLLRAKLDALSRRIFGKKSEQLSDAQLQLLLQEEVAPGPAEGMER